jgi:serine/threonine-protein kinase RsbW
MEIPSNFDAARGAEEALLREVTAHGYSEASAFAIKLALEEGLANAIRHGNRQDGSKKVFLSYDIDERRVVITISDEGPGFDPACVPDPTLDENLDKPSGRGIMLMRAYMDEVQYNQRGNQIRMIKRNI